MLINAPLPERYPYVFDEDIRRLELTANARKLVESALKKTGYPNQALQFDDGFDELPLIDFENVYFQGVLLDFLDCSSCVVELLVNYCTDVKAEITCPSDANLRFTLSEDRMTSVETVIPIIGAWSFVMKDQSGKWRTGILFGTSFWGRWKQHLHKCQTVSIDVPEGGSGTCCIHLD